MRRRVAVAAAAIVLGSCSYSVELDPLEPAAESSRVYAADGSLLALLDSGEHRESVPLDQIAPTVRDAVVAIEDHRFYAHDGVDYRAVARALTRNAAAGEIEEGGSTITQQYVRAVLAGRERTVSRKLREATLAIEIERRLDKDEILERYLNTVYFGGGAYGVQAAADRYFAKPAAELALAEAALLAAVIRSPEYYDAYEHPDRARARRNLVLDKIAEYELASAASVASAQRAALTLSDEHWENRYQAPYFVEQVKRLVLDDPTFGETPADRRRLLYQGGLRIHTTLDRHAQGAAELAVAGTLTDTARDPSAAMVAIEPTTGHVVAYVGGRDYFGDDPAAKFDLASRAHRQAGSSFKPFVLAAAIEAGTALDSTYDAPGEIEIPVRGQPVWTVRNYDGEGGGEMDLVDATVESVNTVFAQLIMDVGAQRVVDTARELGVASALQPYPSAALGTNGVNALDMASAYATLAADGTYNTPVFVTKVTDIDGEILYRRVAAPTRVIESETARQVNAVLEQVVARGTGINARIGRPVAGKTGTGEEWRDAWFVGSTPELTAAVWVGFHDAERSMVPPVTRVKVTGGLWPAQIWAAFASAALADTPASQFPAPGAPEAAAIQPQILADVRGMPGMQAAQLLTRAGFAVAVVDKPDREYSPGRVIAQNPPARSALTPGSEVTLTVARLPEVARVPNLLGDTTSAATAAIEELGLRIEVVREAEPPPRAPAALGRIWKQTPPSGTRVDENALVTIWVNPAPAPPTTTTGAPPPASAPPVQVADTTTPP